MTGMGIMETATRSVLYLRFKRVFDVACSLLGLFVLSPLFLLLALAVKAGDGGPVFFRQQRVGFRGKLFWIYKFRSMRPNAGQMGAQVTRQGDPRITPLGRWLRRYKLDELPQLWNVLRGDMSFVGPRPEVPRYVEKYTPEQRRILDYRPGITDLATLSFRNEEQLLRDADNPEEFYIQHCVPRKFALNLEYARQASFVKDLFIIAQTLVPHTLLVGGLYICAITLSYLAACEIRFEFSIPRKDWRQLMLAGAWFVPLQWVFLLWRRDLQGMLSYFSLRDMRQLSRALLAFTLVAFAAWYVSGGGVAPPRSVILIDAMLVLIGLCGLRIYLRLLREEHFSKPLSPDEKRRRVAVVGNGAISTALVMELQAHPNLDLVAIFDNDAGLWRRSLHGVPVEGPPECLLNRVWKDRLDEVILVINHPVADGLERLSLMLDQAGYVFRVIPSLRQLTSATDEVSAPSLTGTGDLFGSRRVMSEALEGSAAPSPGVN
jgi:lipopolysaccharide/colanic/teichoic acid biosynthesis glycosyltransferase